MRTNDRGRLTVGTQEGRRSLRRSLAWWHVPALLLLAGATQGAGCLDIDFPDPPADEDWTISRVDNNPSLLPVIAVLADLDGDDDLDVVSGWRGADPPDAADPPMIAIHLRQANGNWSTTSIATGNKYTELNAISVADINGDDKPDILAATGDRIVYLRAPATPTSAEGWQARDIAASIDPDFDAWFDLAVGQIDGKFGPDIVAALADDGRLLWLAAPEAPDNPTTGKDWVLHEIDADSRAECDSLILADLNNDTRLDVISSAPGEDTDTIAWYEQPADPIKDAWTKRPISSFAGATRLALGDLDGDGDDDLAVISPGDQRVAWLTRPATVTSRWSGWILAEFGIGLDERFPVDVAIADLNGDDRNEVVIATTGPGGLSYFEPGANSQLNWIETIMNQYSNANTGLFDLGDLDGDDFLDAVSPGDSLRTPTSDGIYAFTNPTTAPAN